MTGGHFLKVWESDKTVIQGPVEEYFDSEIGAHIIRKAKPVKRKRKPKQDTEKEDDRHKAKARSRSLVALRPSGHDENPLTTLKRACIVGSLKSDGGRTVRWHFYLTT